jgi:hypothetical protein
VENDELLRVSHTAKGMRAVTADSIPQLLNVEEDVAEGVMVCEEFDLARTVKENVVL